MILGGVGSVFALVASILLTVGSDAGRARTEHVAGLAVVRPSAIAERRLGESVLVVGRVDLDSARGPEGFVAYTRTRWVRRRAGELAPAGQSRDGYWVVLRAAHPALVLVDGPTRLEITPTYTFGANMREETVEREGGGADDRIIGVRAGDRVVVEGRIVRAPGDASPGARAIAGDVVALGTAASYVQEVDDSSGVTELLGGIFATLSVVLLAIAVRLRF